MIYKTYATDFWGKKLIFLSGTHYATSDNNLIRINNKVY